MAALTVEDEATAPASTHGHMLGPRPSSWEIQFKASDPTTGVVELKALLWGGTADPSPASVIYNLRTGAAARLPALGGV